jgi:predicted MPP superfamily phosphohydrolase
LRETLYFPDLPDAFDGFTITQLSDIHVGSFDTESHRSEVMRGIEMANAQKSDLFVFTGDLVNNKAREMEPWMNEFSKLRAPYGQFSILGNHDYGDYINWDSEASKQANMERLYATHAKLGFSLMRNEHAVIEKNGEKIYLIGVENWGKGGFTKKGDLDKALKDVPADGFKILLSHDPSHFDKIVSVHPTHIPLTLSGHTHGGQFGVEIPGIKISPIEINYPHWAGLYNVNGRNIYVNRGFGFLAFPMRVGVWPEVTVLTLKKGLPNKTA